ncbi:MAG: hypothetical protein GF372_04375 [Candidatus Marinimicrobia bacterium]|nr:hypothetical protein [Candidatus Neomarinimicrobiota bacterium]
MNTYRCIYSDVKKSRKSAIEKLRADAAQEAFEKFIHNRKSEDWSIPEIFSKSFVHIVDEESQEDYIINAYGEVVRKSDNITIAG